MPKISLTTSPTKPAVCDFPNAKDYEERTLKWCICWSREHPEGLENLRPGKEMNGPLRRPDLLYAKRKYKSLGGNNWPQALPACATNNLKRPAASSNNTFANSSNRFPVAAVIQRQTMADLQNHQFMPYQPNDDYSSESNSDPISLYSPPPRNTRRRDNIENEIYSMQGGRDDESNKGKEKEVNDADEEEEVVTQLRRLERTTIKDANEDNVNVSPVAAVMSSSPTAPLSSPQMVWTCSVDDFTPGAVGPAQINTLIDHSSSLVLIDELLVTCLLLKQTNYEHQ
ncbi:hypothetical protein CPB85DRAFT_1445471 [Mucidula mucida]|nr:hypothetical protein CPB85DRAFT_1445471 [Mucidula mucida]